MLGIYGRDHKATILESEIDTRPAVATAEQPKLIPPVLIGEASRIKVDVKHGQCSGGCFFVDLLAELFFVSKLHPYLKAGRKLKPVGSGSTPRIFVSPHPC